MALRNTTEFKAHLQEKINSRRTKILNQDLDYKYPENLDLRPRSELHEEILHQVLLRAQESYSVMEQRFPQWNKITRNLTAYIPLDQVEETDRQADDRKVFRVVMPMSYAIRETFVTYAMSAFLQEPIFPYNPQSSEDIVKVALLEQVVQAQMTNFKAGLQIYKAIQDAATFGLGVLSPVWAQKMGYKTQTRIDLGGGDIYQLSEAERTRQRVVLFEGNKLQCWDPYRTLPDPDVPFDQVQDGEFFGGVTRISKNALINLEAVSKDEYFNCKYVDEIDGESFIVPINNDTGRTEKWGTGISTTSSRTYHRSVDIIDMYIDIIPMDWGLGENEEPEKWLFSIAGDSIVVRAKPLGLDHDMFPVGILSPAYDGHSSTPMSLIETVFGMQELVDNLYNSWWANTRKTVNNILVADPGMVNPNDLKNISKSGGIIRTARSRWGMGVKDAVEQLQIANVTDRNLQNAALVMSTVNDLIGATEPMQGMRRRTSERVSATEASQLAQAGFSKMEKAVKVMSLQGMQDLGYMIAMQTRQLMSLSLYRKITGQTAQELAHEYGLEDFVAITPDAIDVDFDVIPHDGTIPGKGDPQAWSQILGIVTKSPELATQLDVGRIFMHVARISGAKDVHSFMKVQPYVQSDEQVESQVQQGNLVPFDEVAGNGAVSPDIATMMAEG